jgi:pimeloyl-ACP methyl ester carboxylesterase
VVDLVTAADRRVGGSAVPRLLGGPPASVPERYALASPAARLPLGVPQLLVHGEDDATVPPELSRRYAELARRAGDQVELSIEPGVGHMDVIDPDAPAWATVVEWLGRQPTR